MSKVKSFVTATTIAVAASMVGGCVLHGTGEVSTGVAVEPADHRVVQVRPGVWVVENYHAPVFYSDGYYWERRNGYWYRSSYYNGGFVRVGYSVVPNRIRSVKRPRRYVRYRARRGAKYRRVRAHKRGNVRDRRYNRSRARDRRYNRSRARDRRYNNRSRARDRRHNTRSRTRDRRHNTRSRTRDRRGNTRSRTRDRRGNTRSRTRDRRGNTRSKTRDRRSKKRGKTRGKRKRSRDRRH